MNVISPKKSPLFRTMAQFFSKVHECTANQVMNVQVLKMQLFKEWDPDGIFATNETADAGETLRTLFNCIHKQLGMAFRSTATVL